MLEFLSQRAIQVYQAGFGQRAGIPLEGSMFRIRLSMLITAELTIGQGA
jgi:hypothetical protein